MDTTNSHRTLTLGLMLLSGVAIALAFTFLQNSEAWLQILVAMIALGAPFVAGWVSPKLVYALLTPLVMLACLAVAFTLDSGRYWDSHPVVFTIALAIIYGGLGSFVFATGWAIRQLVRKIWKRPQGSPDPHGLTRR